MMTCEEVRELEGAFALGALEPGEAAEVLAHLETCGEHANVSELRAAAMLLDASVEERQPPEALRGRVLASAAGGPAAAKRPFLRIHRWWYAAAASILLVALGAVALFATQGSDSNDDDLFVKEFVSADVSVHFEAKFDETYSRATFAGLAPREEYHLWVIRGDDWLSVGSFRASPEGNWAGDFVFQTKPGDSICLTVANPTPPSGPFGEPIFVEPIS
ncbi:MAG: zf-HC2 domain-containing protein [Dehalococcoidia bacterium]